MEPTPERNPNFIYTPFTPEQVEVLNLFQESGVWHPFTCGNEDRSDLVATQEGWICAKNCGYTQDWA